MNLKKLPYPNVIEVLKYDEILNNIKELFKRYLTSDTELSPAKSGTSSVQGLEGEASRVCSEASGSCETCRSRKTGLARLRS